MFKKYLKKVVILGICSIVFFSCVSNEKLIYIQKLQENRGPLLETSQKYPYVTEEYLLQVNDIVEINIKTTDEKLNLVFGAITNDNQNQMAMGGAQSSGDAFYMNGYTIDDFGMVEVPLLGKLKILGLNTDEAKILVENEMKKFMNEGEYFVRVRLGGVRFSALGEFNRSGKYTILQNRVTILEAIAFAGDLNRVAKRDEILLVRQYPDGSQIHKINLLDRELLGSEFYFVRPNDMIYALPMKVREIGAGNTLVETLTLVTTSITAVALILTIIRNQ